LIYDNEKRVSQGYAQTELGEYRAFGKEVATAIKGGHALQPNQRRHGACTQWQALHHRRALRRDQGTAAGYYLVEARDREEAIGIAAKIPGARFESVEGRPILTLS